ncbi:MAG: MlaD family protein [Solirubrobacteraceae bacterium]
MRRLLALTLALFCAGALAVLGTGAGDDSSGDYKVRAIFQNAFSLVSGEDVKIAGVKVGSIESLDVTEDQQAAVVLAITRAGFGDWREDAECTIRPQSLIGEKFVECTPTQPRPAGTPLPPPLEEIAEGEQGAGQRLLPVEQTSRPVDIDLVNNIMRLPFRQRLGIIINEFGTGLAGRGEDLREVIRNADPALKATDKVLKLLAGQEKVLAELARQSDAALEPLADEREAIQGFVENAANVATATAERQGAFRAQFEKLPVFLRELRPTMARLGGFADEATPVLANLGAVAPQVSRFIKALGPFSSSATVSLQSLGEATVPGRKALVAAESIVDDLARFGRQAKPLSRNLSALLRSFKATGGIERLMDYLFYQVAAINGFDQFGHYLRASLIVNLCSTYATTATKDVACTANFQKPFARSAGNAMTAEDALRVPGQSLTTRRTGAVLRGMSPEEALRLTAGETDPGVDGSATGGATADPGLSASEQQALQGLSSERSGAKPRAEEQMLDYLLGGEAQ